MGLLYAYTKQYVESINYSNLGINLARQLGEVETEGKFHANLGEAYLGCKEYIKAIESTRTALDIAKQIGDVTGELNRKINLFTIEFVAGTIEANLCIEIANKMLKCAITRGLKLYAANCYNLIGDCHVSNNEITLAIKSWKEAQALYCKIAPPKGNELSNKIRNHTHSA